MYCSSWFLSCSDRIAALAEISFSCSPITIMRRMPEEKNIWGGATITALDSCGRDLIIREDRDASSITRRSFRGIDSSPIKAATVSNSSVTAVHTCRFRSMPRSSP